MYVNAGHPIASFAREVNAELDELSRVDPLYMPTSVKKAALVELEQARHRIAALEMRMMASGGDLTEDGAYRTVADFVSDQTRTDRAPLVAMERLGRALEDRWQTLGAAVADGAVSIPKAHVLAKAPGWAPG